MAIIVYTGVMGAGKSYEAVSTGALTALKAGRRVVTNIKGFSYEKIRDYLGEFPDGSMLEPEKVVVVTTERITEERFFFDPDSQEEAVVKPGDLVLIDEAWEFWGIGFKLLPEHQKFFRMHRHYTDATTGLCCDLLVMIQDLGTLHRFIRGVTESNFKFTKMKTLGLSTRYRVEVYEGNSQRKASLVSANIKKYNKAIFPLYKSYDGGIGKESIVDNRQNLLSNKWFLLAFVGSFAGLVGAGSWFYKYVSRLRHPDVASESVAAASKAPAGIRASAGSAGAVSAVVPPSILPQRTGALLVGVWSTPKGGGQALVKTAEGRYTFFPVRAGVVDGWSSQVEFDGAMVTFGLGQAAAASAQAK